MMRIVVFSERLQPPFDEGIKNYAFHLARELSKLHQVMLLTAFGASLPDLGIENLPSNPLLLSLPFARRLRQFRPDVICYVPTACATLFSFWRARMLKAFGGGAPIVLVALQVRSYGRFARAVMPHLHPDLVLVQAERTQSSLEPFGCKLALLTPGVDLERFSPAAPESRAALRIRYGVAPQAYVALHVGHLNRGRNVQALVGLQGYANIQVVVAGSTSTPKDEELVAELRRAGIKVIDHFVADIAELYRLADCYVFPVEGRNSAIDLPLSVLEAMACDLPIVTTRFGGLPALFEPAAGVRYVADLQELPGAVAACQGLDAPGTRALVAPYAWTRIAEQVLATVSQILGQRTP
jgi:glycosyltransferase involved in cell wall biosynthesis